MPRKPGNAKARPRSPTSGSQSKRPRLLTPAGRDQVNVNNGDAQQNQLQKIASDAREEIRSQKWAVIVASATKQPYDSQVQQYKEWKRAGSKHDGHCCICLRAERERHMQCHTCKIVFHPECLSRGSYSIRNHTFYCSICIDRSWDSSPPDTLPVSLEPTSAQTHGPPSHTTTDNSNAASIPHLQYPTPSLNLQREGHRTQSATRVYRPRGTDRNTSHGIAHPGPAGQTATESPQRTDHQRKLDYTLSSDVLSSLYRLYREIELVASLRAEIEELRAQNTKYAETIRMNKRFRDALLAGIQNSQTMDARFVGTAENINDMFANLEELVVSERQTASAKEPK
ncbi:hypothetical protein PENFLA_c002G03433 [Penicillium flavigenum]|uniref:Zinc finger PHD-type domain-containing protein n=1 Tax=Penicillium flavigenum TaxID=254877 RepID=A0A1V6TWM5_9EURO|nr:hypothetical protein PENFLA_c002G03433 [Penicillium flavigenum]